VSSVLVSGTNLYIEYGTGNFPDRRFNAPWPLDEPVRDALRADTADGRNVAGRWSDYFWHVPQYYSVLIDSVYVPLVLDDVNFEVAWQMTMLNWQAIGFAFFLTRVTHATVGRARPSQHRCVDDPTAENRCGSEGPSFFSGHTSMAATGAGLTCAHHTALPLYGGGWPDTAICVVMSTAAGVNGFLRIHSDRHWFSDVVVGYVLGWGIGFGVPWLLHYGRKSATAPLGAELLPKGVAIVPLAFEGGAGLGLTGAL
jgi:hypothetical protein